MSFTAETVHDLTNNRVNKALSLPSFKSIITHRSQIHRLWGRSITTLSYCTAAEVIFTSLIHKARDILSSLAVHSANWSNPYSPQTKKDQQAGNSGGYIVKRQTTGRAANSKVGSKPISKMMQMASKRLRCPQENPDTHCVCSHDAHKCKWLPAPTPARECAAGRSALLSSANGTVSGRQMVTRLPSN